MTHKNMDNKLKLDETGHGLNEMDQDKAHHTKREKALKLQVESYGRSQTPTGRDSNQEK